MSAKEINASIYVDSVERIIRDTGLLTNEKCNALYSLLSHLIEEIIAFSDIQFTTRFSQIVYLVTYYKLPVDVSKSMHLLRRRYEQEQRYDDMDAVIDLHCEVLYSLLSLTDGEYISHIREQSKQLFLQSYDTETRYIHALRGMIVSLDTEEKMGTIASEEDGEHLRFRYDVPGENDIFTTTMEAFYREGGTPFLCQFVHINVDGDILVPKFIVLMPDYLIDVTSISESFKGRTTFAGLSFLRKFKSLDPSFVPLLVGNIVNTLFDQLISNPSLVFSDILTSIFKKYGMLLSLYTDDELKNILAVLKRHFTHLKGVVHGFEKQGIHIEHTYTEPAYYSVKYGLQGRLDLLHEDDDRVDVIELKSGSPYMSNTYGLSTNHYVQSLLYDLMLESTARKKKVRRAFILYSKLNDGLRYAPAITAQQMEALMVRNAQVLIEYLLQSPEGVERMIASMRTEKYAQAGGFVVKDVEVFQHVMQKLSALEYAYFTEFVSFLAREQRNNKTGKYGRYSDNGLSNIWTLTEQEKEERFALMKKCTIHHIHQDEVRTTIILHKTQDTNVLSNFRVGDVIILYPYRKVSMDTIRSQIFKCTLVAHNSEEVKVQLRGKVYNQDVFSRYKHWNIEPDVLDSSFGAAYRSLYGFMKANKGQKELILGLKKPRQYDTEGVTIQLKSDLTVEQAEICRKAIASRDYFLIWGPPGTGKTSKLLRSMVASLYDQGEIVLVLAYTNRAVDEICHALGSIAPDFQDHFMRIGSLHGCSELYRHRLMDEAIRKMDTRKEIVDTLTNTKIVVGTISSVLNRPELFRLVSFSRLIIDEASQVLEPMLVRLLADIPHWVLVGDHRQLPAVVTQDTHKRRTHSSRLHEIGIEDLGLSLFERMYRRCIDQQWTHALGMLSAQGRMHKDIAIFPSKHFYDGKLANLPIERLDSDKPYLDWGMDGTHRMVYIDTAVDDTIEWKTNIYEAQMAVDLVCSIVKQYQVADRTLHNETVGIITPYRAQIALIRSLLQSACPDRMDLISVDTVERYQGGARDIIIYSMCSNNPRQFDKLVQQDAEGIDRKLNVALTRAREQLVLLGNREVLGYFAMYAALMEYCTEISCE